MKTSESLSFLPMDRFEAKIILYCETLKAKLLLKYRNGKAAHGGKGPFQIDVNDEIRQELLDIINYHLIGIVNIKLQEKETND